MQRTHCWYKTNLYTGLFLPLKMTNQFCLFFKNDHICVLTAPKAFTVLFPDNFFVPLQTDLKGVFSTN